MKMSKTVDQWEELKKVKNEMKENKSQMELR
jgi:hypothetical protein